MSVAQRIIAEIVKQNMVRVSYPDPQASHVFVWSANAEDQIMALLGETHGRLEALETLDGFMERLAENGGSIVSSAACSINELADAQADKRFLMRADGLGFVLRKQVANLPGGVEG